MKTSSKIAFAFAGFATLVATSAMADQRDRFGGRDGGFGGDIMRPNLAEIDANDDGSITYAEFAAVFGDRFKEADANSDGTLTVEEVAAGIQKIMAERMAAQLIKRLDTDENGTLTLTEVESQQKKLFAMADRDDSGTVEADEMPRRRGFDDRDGDRRGPKRWFGHRDR